jgi:hypothetical protein
MKNTRLGLRATTSPDRLGLKKLTSPDETELDRVNITKRPSFREITMQMGQAWETRYQRKGGVEKMNIAWWTELERINIAIRLRE